MTDVNSPRAANRSRVLNALIDGAADMRTGLAARLDLSAMAVTRAVRELAEAGLVAEADRRVRPEPGRRPVGLALQAKGAYVVGVELHAYQCSAAVMDLTRRVIKRGAVTFSAPADSIRAIADIAAAVQRLIADAQIAAGRVLGLGVAAMGVVDRERGELVDPSYLGWDPVDLAARLRQATGLPVVIDRIANVYLAAEASTAAAPTRNAILVNIGFVLSAAFLVGGVIARGDRLLAGRIGHIAIPGHERLCQCGQRGCLEVAASGWAALADLGELADPALTAEGLHANRDRLTDLLRRGAADDRAAQGALERVGRNLGRGLVGLRTALDPERVLLTGSVGRAAAFVAGVQQAIGPDGAALVEPCNRPMYEAAALMAFDEFVRTPRLDVNRLRPAPAQNSARPVGA